MVMTSWFESTCFLNLGTIFETVFICFPDFEGAISIFEDAGRTIPLAYSVKAIVFFPYIKSKDEVSYNPLMEINN